MQTETTLALPRIPMVFLLRGGTKVVLLRAAVMIVCIALADWRVDGDVPLGFLYLFPMVLVGSVLSRSGIAAVAGLCTALTEFFDAFAWSVASGVPRDILIFAAFCGAGLVVYEAVRGRHAALRHVQQIQAEMTARQDAEEQLKVLVESSPAAILTAGPDGCVLLANDAAHRMLALPAGALRGISLAQYLPALAHVPAAGNNGPGFRTAMQCRGRRHDGEAFVADVWFSTYRTAAGPRLAAMIVDASEDLRNREQLGLHQLLAASRILVGAVSHEVRNVCGAIALVHANLARGGALAGNKDFEALGTLIDALEKIAAMNLRQTANQAARTDLPSLLEELRIVIEPSLRESGIEVRWTIADGLRPVWAERQSLMQVFLNLIKNSERVLLDSAAREITVSATDGARGAVVRFTDTGPGVSNPAQLFRPFQHGAQATGLGLYLSRALVRSFRGDLRYEPQSPGAAFVVELSTAPSDKDAYEPGDPDSAGRRPQPLPGEPEPVATGRA